jgi:hypothetical protein
MALVEPINVHTFTGEVPDDFRARLESIVLRRLRWRKDPVCIACASGRAIFRQDDSQPPGHVRNVLREAVDDEVETVSIR